MLNNEALDNDFGFNLVVDFLIIKRSVSVFAVANSLVMNGSVEVLESELRRDVANIASAITKGVFGFFFPFLLRLVFFD